MRRRLTLALFGFAFATIVLVGLGVLVLARVGARDDARSQVAEQLDALSLIAQDVRSFDRLGPVFGRIEQAFGGAIEPVIVDADGELSLPGQGTASRIDLVRLDEDQLKRLMAGEQLVVDARRSVIGLQILSLDRIDRSAVSDQRLGSDRIVALAVEQDVASAGRLPLLWFLLSASGVLVASLLLATWLADRFTRPLQAIEHATARIAGGDLHARILVEGDDEVADLGRAVNHMAADLERSRAAEQEFLLSISHDLRTPLTAIAGYAEALVDRAIDDSAQAGQVIAINAGRLERLVADLLDLARLNAHQFRMEAQFTDAAIVTARTVAGLQPKARSYGLDLSFLATTSGPAPDRAVAIPSADQIILADADRLAPAIGNVVDNAIKFASSSIVVMSSSDGSVLTLTVTDDGPGIGADDLPFVFDRLYVTKLEPVRAENSSGLGLAIVRELVHAMGGSVQASSVRGSGTTITLTFPVASRTETP